MRRHVLPLLAIAGCVIGPRPMRHSINASIIGVGTTMAVATALNPCVMHSPGLLNFDDLCQGINNGAIAMGVGLAVAGVLGFVANSFPDDTSHSKE